MTRQELIQELMEDSQTYCCYCGTPKVRFSCCGENHFETFAEMNKETQESILSDMASEVSDFWEGYVPEPDSTCNSNYRLDPPGLDQLYTSPPAQRKPLTRNQVKRLITATGYDTASPQERTDFINGIRHAEAAHGIKENT